MSGGEAGLLLLKPNDKSKHSVHLFVQVEAQIGMDGTSIITNIKDNFPSPPSHHAPAIYVAGSQLMPLPCDLPRLLLCGTVNTTAAEAHFGGNYACSD